MSTGEKDRASGEMNRTEAVAQTLPTVNPDLEKKPEPPSSSLHPAVYIMYALNETEVGVLSG